MTKKLYNDTTKWHNIDTYMLYYPILNVETIIHQDTFSQEIALTDMKLQMKYPGKYLNKQCHRSDYECVGAVGKVSRERGAFVWVHGYKVCFEYSSFAVYYILCIFLRIYPVL